MSSHGAVSPGAEAVDHVAEDARDVVVVAVVGEATAEGDGPHREDRPTARQLCIGHVRAYHPRGPLAGGRGEVAQELLEDHHEARTVPFRAGNDDGAGRRSQGGVGAVELEAGRPAAGEAEVADHLVLHAVENPGDARVVGPGTSPIVGALEEALRGEAHAHELLRRAAVAPPEPSVGSVERVIVLADTRLPRPDARLRAAHLEHTGQRRTRRDAPVETVAPQIDEVSAPSRYAACASSVRMVWYSGCEPVSTVVYGARSGAPSASTSSSVTMSNAIPCWVSQSMRCVSAE